MRITSQQPRNDHRRLSDCGQRAIASGQLIAVGLARVMVSLALSALLTHPVAAENDKNIEKAAIPSWYTQTFTRDNTGLNVTYLWALKSKLRAETVIRGHNLVTIVNGDTYYVYDALTKTGIAVRRAPASLAAESPDHRPFGNEAQIMIDQGGEKIREEGVTGKRSDVYQITDENGRRIVWVTQDDRRLPIRIEIFNRKSGSTRYKEYADWVMGLPITDAYFELEPSIQFERFELDEYIAATIAKGYASTLPILYRDLLFGPTPR